MKKHKLEGYCIRGGEGIADRMRKVFEADGVDLNGWFCDGSHIYFIDNAGMLQHNYDSIVKKSFNLKEITIDQAERIVFGESQKTFPRMMEVSDDGVTWDECIVQCQLKGVEWPYITGGLDGEYNGYKHAREIQPEPSPEITDEVMIKAVERLCEMVKDYSDNPTDSLRFWVDGDITIHDSGYLTNFTSIPELIKHLRDEK